MGRPSVVLGVLVLVVVAGCTTANPADVEPTATPPSDSFEPRYPPPVAADPPDNPWHTSTIEVVVENGSGVDQDVRPQVARALSYWRAEADGHDTYDPPFRLVNETESPELRVRVVKAIDSCGERATGVVLGCAPTLAADESVNGTAVVRVRGGHAPATTLAILKHEFGHALGLGHGASTPVMSEELAARAPSNVIDAEHRRYPWSTGTLRVAVVSERGVSDGERERVERALAYYQRGADGTVTSPPSFRYVDDPSSADVVVDIRPSVVDCETMGADHSCVSWRGPSVDDDPQPEYLTGARIVVGDTEKVGWHVGYWLGRSLWTNGVPTPFTTHSQPPATSW